MVKRVSAPKTGLVSMALVTIRIPMFVKGLVYRLAARLRGPCTLRALRLVRHLPGGARLADRWDPNLIRRYCALPLGERRHLFRGNGYSLYIDLNDHVGFRTFMRREPFEMATHRVATLLGLGPGDVILDVGAHIGTASVPVCAQRGCELYAVEASRGNADLLVRNIFENRLRAKVALVALTAPGPKHAYIPLHIRKGNTGANSINVGWNPSLKDPQVEWVPTAHLDDLLTPKETARVSLVKIDVEGAEVEVLSGGRTFLESCRAPIILEWRSDGVERYLRSDLSGLFELLSKTHELHSLASDGGLGPFEPTSSYENVVAIPLSAKDEILVRFRETASRDPRP